MTKVESAVQWMCGIAADNSHGYDQAYRWNEKGDYDCSSLVISAYEQAGVPVKSKGATYTGNMKSVFLKCGFEDVTSSCNLKTASGMERGDVLLNEVTHTALYIGNNRIVHAAGNERGGATGGTPGDQTGGEICERSYYNSPWDCVLRYTEGGEATTTVTSSRIACTVTLPEINPGDKGEDVKAMQDLLILRGYSCGGYGADGDYGSATKFAVIDFQQDEGLDVDGVCGKDTWTALIKG